MITTRPDGVLEITAHAPDTLENDLNAAEQIAREHAMQHGLHGVLVTQHGYTSFTVTLSPDVPYGLTRLRREWRQTS